MLPLAAALDGNDDLTLTLTGEVEVSGRFLRAESDRIVLSGEVGIVEVPAGGRRSLASFLIILSSC